MRIPFESAGEEGLTVSDRKSVSWESDVKPTRGNLLSTASDRGGKPRTTFAAVVNTSVHKFTLSEIYIITLNQTKIAIYKLDYY